MEGGTKQLHMLPSCLILLSDIRYLAVRHTYPVLVATYPLRLGSKTKTLSKYCFGARLEVKKCCKCKDPK